MAAGRSELPLRGWVKVLLALLAALVVLLALNAIAVTNETKDAGLNVEGAELVETSNGTLQVLDEGNPEGSPIVLIHGYTASMNWFEQLAPLLAAQHRVISVDLLGHGGSEKPSAGYEISDQANAIAEALAGMEVTDATVVGHSLGGTVATALAEQSPDLAPRVVILDQAIDDSYEHLSFAAKLGYRPVIGPALDRLMQLAPSSAVRAQYDQAFAPGFNIASGFENPDQVVDDLREMTYAAFTDVADAESSYSDTRPLNERLSALQIPLLVVFGTEDQIYDAVPAIQPYEDIEGVQTELLDGVGHSPNVEAPERTAALIEAFIARTERQQAAARRAEARAAAAKRAKRRAARKRAEAKAKGGKKSGKDSGGGQKESKGSSSKSSAQTEQQVGQAKTVTENIKKP